MHGVPILPGVFNKPPTGDWDGKMADALLLSPKARANMIASLVANAQKRGYAGYVFDFEELSEAGLRAYPGFIAEARRLVAS